MRAIAKAIIHSVFIAIGFVAGALGAIAGLFAICLLLLTAAIVDGSTKP